MIIAVGNDGQFVKLASALGAPGLTRDPRFATNSARVAHRAELKRELERLLHHAGADHWQSTIADAGVPCGPINDIEQGFALADRLGLRPIIAIDDPRRTTPQRQVANPATLSATPPTYRSAPPAVGEDRAAVLALLDEGDVGA